MWDGACAGAAAKQSSIFHASLLRVLEPAQLPQEALAAIHTACRQQSERLRGLRFMPDAMWCAVLTKEHFEGGPVRYCMHSVYICKRASIHTLT